MRPWLLSLVALLLLACGGADEAPLDRGAGTEAEAVSQRPIDEVLASIDDDWIARDGIHALYVSADAQGRPVLKVLVDDGRNDVAESLPEQVEGYTIVVEFSGPIEPLGN